MKYKIIDYQKKKKKKFIGKEKGKILFDFKSKEKIFDRQSRLVSKSNRVFVQISKKNRYLRILRRTIAKKLNELSDLLNKHKTRISVELMISENNAIMDVIKEKMETKIDTAALTNRSGTTSALSHNPAFAFFSSFDHQLDFGPRQFAFVLRLFR